MAFLNVLKCLTSGEKSESEEYATQGGVTHSEVQQKGLRCGALLPFPITRLSRAELRPTAVELETAIHNPEGSKAHPVVCEWVNPLVLWAKIHY